MGRHRHGGAEGVGLEKKARDGLTAELRAVVEDGQKTLGKSRLGKPTCHSRERTQERCPEGLETG